MKPNDLAAKIAGNTKKVTHSFGNLTTVLPTQQEIAPTPKPSLPGSALLSSLLSGYQTVAKGTARALGASEAAPASSTASYDASQALLVKLAKDKTIPAERRAKLIQALNENQAGVSTQAAETTKQIESETNKRKFLAGTGEVAFDILTAGTVSSAAKAGKVAGKTALKTAGRAAVEGGTANALNYLATNDEVNAAELAKATGTGAAFGGALAIAPFASKALNDKLKAANITGKADELLSKTRVGQKVLDARDAIIKGFVDNTAPLKKAFAGALDNGRKIADIIDEKVGNVRRSDAQAAAFLRENQAWSELGKHLKDNKTNLDEIVKFIKERQNAINNNKLIESGARKGELVDIPVGTPVQEKAYELLNQSTKDVVERAYKAGLIDETKYTQWINDPDYTRVQRELDDYVRPPGARQGAEASIATNITQQKLKGSSKEALDPFASFVDWNRRITRDINRNDLATYVTTKLEEQGQGKFLREADNVIGRKDLYQQASALRPLREKLKKLVKSQSKYAARLDKELKQLRGQALKEVESKLKKATQDKVVGEGGVTAANIKGVIDEIMSTDTGTLNRLNKKYMNREPKYAQAIADLANIKKEYDAAATEIADIVTKARGMKDKLGLNENTVKRFTKGVKEVFETDPTVARAINNVDQITFGALQRWLTAPSRALRLGATGLNVAFAIPNFVADQLTSAVLTKDLRATHNPINFFRALKETAAYTAGKEGMSKEFKLFLKDNASMNSADLYRDLKKATTEAYESLGLKREGPIRKLEDVISATETSTRYQNWLGTYKKALKEAPDDVEGAISKANLASRRNSVDFSQQGEYTAFLRVINPYLNASIQGSRSLARAFKENPLTTGLKVGTTVMGPVASATYWNLSDPGRAQLYANIPEYERNGNLIFVLGNGDKGYIKLKMPPGISSFGKPLRNMIEAEYLGDRQGFTETAKNLLLDPFNPLGDTKNATLSTLTPQPIRPAVETAMNRNLFTGNEIVPTNLQDELPADQVFKNTSQSYRDIASKLGMSPLQVQNLVRGYGASGGEQVLETTDLARKLAGQDVKTGGRDVGSQVVQRFYRKEAPGSGEVTKKFYENYNATKNDNSRTSKKITEALKAGRDAEADRLARELNSRVDAKINDFKTKYGRYEKDSELLKKLEELKINLTDRSKKQRKKK